MARKHESRFLISFMTIIQTGPVDSCWIICMMKLFDNKHVDGKCIGSCWCLNIKKIRGVDKNLWLVYFYQPWAICGIFFRGCSQSPRLFSTFDPNLFHLWRQWGSWVAPGSRALHCIGAHQRCPTLVPTKAEYTKCNLGQWHASDVQTGTDAQNALAIGNS